MKKFVPILLTALLATCSLVPAKAISWDTHPKEGTIIQEGRAMDMKRHTIIRYVGSSVVAAGYADVIHDRGAGSDGWTLRISDEGNAVKASFLFDKTEVPLTPVPGNGRSFWFKINPAEILAHKDSHSQTLLLDNQEGNKTVRRKVPAKDLADFIEAQAEGTSSASAPNPTYGPSYSIFYPGVPAKKLRNAMAYYLNQPEEPGDPHLYRKGPVFYCLPENFPLMISDQAMARGFCLVDFAEIPGKGTWADLTWAGQPENVEINAGIFAAAKAYRNLVDHCDYGLTLNGGPNKSPITIDTIDTANHPELSAVGHSDRLLSINGYDLEKGKNLEAQYMLDYGDEPLEMVLRKKDSNATYKVTALPIKKPALHPDGDYTGALAKQDHLQMKEKELYNFLPFLFFPAQEIFSPEGSQYAHNDSPITESLTRQCQRKSE